MLPLLLREERELHRRSPIPSQTADARRRWTAVSLMFQQLLDRYRPMFAGGRPHYGHARCYILSDNRARGDQRIFADEIPGRIVAFAPILAPLKHGHSAMIAETVPRAANKAVIGKCDFRRDKTVVTDG